MAKIQTTQDMLRVIINGQSAFRQEVLGNIEKLDKKIDSLDHKLTEKIDKVEKNLTDRIDKIGKQLAYLEDDTPTREEFTKLEKRVNKAESKSSPIL